MPLLLHGLEEWQDFHSSRQTPMPVPAQARGSMFSPLTHRWRGHQGASLIVALARAALDTIWPAFEALRAAAEAFVGKRDVFGNRQPWYYTRIG